MISALTNWLSGIVGAEPKRHGTRLDESAVLAIAKAALLDSQASQALVDRLIVSGVALVGSELVWSVDTRTRGSGVSVDVSDSNGRVVNIRYRSSR